MNAGTTRSLVRCLSCGVALALVAGCATPPPATAPVAAPATAPVAAPAPEAPKPIAAPVVPELPPAQAKAQAQKIAMEAVVQLQNGDEASARKTLEQAQQLDPSNDLARKLMDQVNADPQKELGTVFFRYTVKPDDSLSKLAQQYLGDRFRFHILAKYNDIANPSRLTSGQVIKIPGRAPAVVAPLPAVPRPGLADAGEDAAKVAAIDNATPRSAATGLMQQGAAMQKAGNLEGAYDAFRDAAQRDPGNRDAIQQRDAARQALVRRFEREATQSFQRQNLDDAIGKWDRVLALEPGNQKAKLERERALDLRKKMSDKFGGK